MRSARARVPSFCAAATLTPLLGALAVESAREQRRALAQGQVGEVVDEAANGLLAAQHGFGVPAIAGPADRLRVQRLVAPALATDLVDRAVADEAIQPRSQLVGRVARAQRVERADEDVLHDVLGVVLGAAQQRPA